MANKWSDGDFQVSANQMLAASVKLAVAERMAPPNHPALAAGYLGNVAGSGAQTVVQKMGDFGSGVASTFAEDGAVGTDDITYTDYSATVVRKAKGRSATDFARFLDPISGTILNPQLMALDAISIRNNTLMQLVAEAGSSFATYSAGSTGTDLTWAKIRAAKNDLMEGNVQFADGELVCILHPHNWADLETDLLVTLTSDAMTHAPEAGAMRVARASGYQGRYFGIDFYTSTRVPTANAGADYAGCLVAPGGIAWADGSFAPDPHAFQDILDGGKLMIEYDRDPSRALKKLFYNFRVGASVGDDNRGVKLIAGVS